MDCAQLNKDLDMLRAYDDAIRERLDYAMETRRGGIELRKTLNDFLKNGDFFSKYLDTFEEQYPDKWFRGFDHGFGAVEGVDEEMSREIFNNINFEAKGETPFVIMSIPLDLDPAGKEAYRECLEKYQVSWDDSWDSFFGDDFSKNVLPHLLKVCQDNYLGDGKNHMVLEVIFSHKDLGDGMDHVSSVQYDVCFLEGGKIITISHFDHSEMNSYQNTGGEISFDTDAPYGMMGGVNTRGPYSVLVLDGRTVAIGCTSGSIALLALDKNNEWHLGDIVKWDGAKRPELCLLEDNKIGLYDDFSGKSGILHTSIDPMLIINALAGKETE